MYAGLKPTNCRLRRHPPARTSPTSGRKHRRLCLHSSLLGHGPVAPKTVFVLLVSIPIAPLKF